MSTLCRTYKGDFRTHLGSEQYAVGGGAALEKLSAMMSVLLLQHPEAAIIQIDVVSAFNHMLREIMVEEIENCCPQLFSAFSLGLAKESVVFIIDGRVIKVRQGSELIR